MYVKTFVKSALIATILFGLSSGAAPNSAEAGDFYTRKRVNGVWITGQFPKKHVIRAKEARNQLVVAAAAAPSMPSSLPSTLGEGVDRPPLFQRASEARRAALTAEPLGESPTVSMAQEPRLIPLQRALEARAKSMSSGTLPPRALKVVTFNFETGVRTSVYEDGSIVEERFDPVSAPVTFARR
jgi:hypothetical protein